MHHSSYRSWIRLVGSIFLSFVPAFFSLRYVQYVDPKIDASWPLSIVISIAFLILYSFGIYKAFQYFVNFKGVYWRSIFLVAAVLGYAFGSYFIQNVASENVITVARLVNQIYDNSMWIMGMKDILVLTKIIVATAFVGYFVVFVDITTKFMRK